MKLEQTECFKTSAYKIQTSRNYLEENIQHDQVLFLYEDITRHVYYKTRRYKDEKICKVMF
jgi:hypothetical protein